MSSYYVRQTVEGWVMANAGLPYFPTINFMPSPTVDMWLSLDFMAFGATKETFCGEFVEDGEIIFMFFGRVGIGFDALFQAAEMYVDEIMQSIDPTGRLTLIRALPANDNAGDDDPWFVCEIAVDYQLRG